MFSRTLGLVFGMAVASATGFWLDGPQGLLAGALIVCVYTLLKDLWKGQKLANWLRHNNVQEPPEMGGFGAISSTA